MHVCTKGWLLRYLAAAFMVMLKHLFITLPASDIISMRPTFDVQELISVPVVLHALIDQVAQSAALASVVEPALPALTADAFAASPLPEGAGRMPPVTWIMPVIVVT